MSTYLSEDGLKKLKEEWEERTKDLRKKITERISSAKELGDLSENFEYHNAKEQQGLNEMRILELDEMIKDAVIVEQKSGGTMIQIGSSFTVETEGKEISYELVGSNEANPLEGKISNESPMGKAFLGRSLSDSVAVKTPNGEIMYTILAIK